MGSVNTKPSNVQATDWHRKKNQAKIHGLNQCICHSPSMSGMVTIRNNGVTSRRWHRMNRVDCSFVLFSHITVMSHWALWRLKSPASRLFAQPFFSDAYQRKFQRSASQNFVRESHHWLMDSSYKVSATRKIFPYEYVIMTKSRESVISNEYCWYSFKCWVCSTSWWC